jgi:hypothetical protein
MAHFTQKEISFAKKHGVTITQPENNNAQSTLILLVGWMGATPRLLRHYIKLYNDMNYTVVSFIPSGLQL